MPRFFVQPQQITSNTIQITGSDARHISKVLRMAPGDCVTVCDGRGADYQCTIRTASSDCVSLLIEDFHASATEPPIKITLYQALPKASKMETIIQKCTELGISKIIPCITARCIVKLENDSSVQKKVARWQAIAEEAAKQSQRGVIPVVETPLALPQAVQSLGGHDLKFAAYELERRQGLRELLQKASASKPETVGFFIGPEGGIADEEAALFANHQIPTVTLGPRILRCETAPIALLSMVMYELGDVDPEKSNYI